MGEKLKNINFCTQIRAILPLFWGKMVKNIDKNATNPP
jgi:hypothetical protein